MAQKPFLALVIPAAETTGQPPGVPPGHAPGGPPGHAGTPTHPIVIEPPEVPDVDVPEGSKLILVWDGEAWQWAVVAPGMPAQPIAPRPAPKR
jgi:hypothetical protein